MAIADSSKGHYVAGAVGTVTRLNPQDPVIKWDKNGQENQTNRLELHQTKRGKLQHAHSPISSAAATGPQHNLADGTVAVVGMRVVAIYDSSLGRYVAGDLGTVTRLN